MSDVQKEFGEFFSERDLFLMQEAMSAGHYYESLGDWLSEIIADGGYIVAQHLSHDADKKKAARAQGAEPVGFIQSGGIKSLRHGHPARIYPCGCAPSPLESHFYVYAQPPKPEVEGYE